MAKKSDMSNIKNLGMGILDTLSGIKEEKDKESLEEKEELNIKKEALEETIKAAEQNTKDTLKEDIKNVIDESSSEVIEENKKKVLEVKNKNVNKEKSKGVKVDSSNSSEVKNSISSKEAKSKRSFMLTETTIQRLNLLKLCMGDKDLSTIVEESVGLYFEKNKESIEALISIYDKVK